MQTAFHLFKFGAAERRGDASQSLSMGPSAKSYTHRAVEHGVRRLEGRLVHFTWADERFDAKPTPVFIRLRVISADKVPRDARGGGVGVGVD